MYARRRHYRYQKCYVPDLLVCSRNKWRSQTEHKIYLNDSNINARSTATSNSAKRTVFHKKIAWLDILEDCKFIDLKLVEIFIGKVEHQVGKRLSKDPLKTT